MSTLEKLTEGIVDRDLSKESTALRSKWEATGLLEGLGGEQNKDQMSRLLENQAKELLREASAMSSGDVEGFAAVAFPIVRRVFGGLIANELVSVQPMSLPSGLVFFLDFQLTNDRGGEGASTNPYTFNKDDSIYGGGVVGSELTGGVSDLSEDGGGFYNLNNGYSSPTGSLDLGNAKLAATTSETTGSSITGALAKRIQYDPDVLADSTGTYCEIDVTLTQAQLAAINRDNLVACNLTKQDGALLTTTTKVIRRLTKLKDTGTGNPKVSFILTGTHARAATVAALDATVHYPAVDNLTSGDALGSLVGTTPWGLEGTNTLTNTGTNDAIPEIDIKVNSVAVTAVTKKLKAKWSPELGQDLNAYHNLDAEVELTNVLSEHIALEIDQEILQDLIKGATAGTKYWSRRPGKFLDRSTGSAIEDWSSSGIDSAANLLGGDFTGTVSEWYETLLETVNDISADIHRKTLKGGANFIVVSPEAANILEFTAGFKAKVTHDDDKGTAGAVNVGSLSGKLEVYVDPYFARNVILVGRKGSSFLESGYVYAPYVPLQVTPTIFGPEDFVPRKGVMTRYAKKMVRPDMYGLVVITDFNG